MTARGATRIFLLVLLAACADADAATTPIRRDRSYPNGSSELRLGDLLGTALNVREPEILITATLEDDDDTRSAPGFGSIRCK